MTQLAQQKRWLNIAEAAEVAGRTERTLRNWVRDGVLKPAVRGFFDRDVVLATAKRMTTRRGRPTATASRIVEAAPGSWIKATACGTHSDALEAGLVALTCRRCRIEPTEAPVDGDGDA
ncbi:MerR family transcriptional regulator [Microbacterium sp. STF-2]|uniref:helix-turn-helix domain-containing protein n=1 Tax=Microbacterium sp. STF-2 TaxID=3031132 RepID=UPI002AFF24B3|nr:helix-turn-helix domain-containing protein [Microbacterium sp. STF-2]MEA1264179.1 MerR family transcriptional regulator [Microbacterium sp. STF-2]